MVETKENVAVAFEVTGIEKIRKEFNRLNKGFLSLDDAAKKATNNMVGSVNKLNNSMNGLGKQLIPTKGGFEKDSFLSMGEFQKNTEMFGNKIKDSFETIKNVGKDTSFGINPKELEDLQSNFKKVGTAITAENVKFTRQQNNVNKLMSGGANDLLKNADNINQLEQAHNGFGKALFMNSEKLNTFVKGGGEFSNILARWGHNIKMSTAGLRGFRMEMLGVMFFGMGMTRLFGGMLKPAANLMGVFDLWSETLSVVFLPTMIDLFPAILNVSQALMDLPEGAKDIIGGITVAGLGLGKVFAIGGSLALGIGSLITAFGEAKTSGALLENSLTSLNKVARGISFVAGLALTYVWAKDVKTMMSDLETSWTDRIKNVFTGALAGALIGFTFGGAGGAVIGATIGLGLSLVVNLLDIAWEKGWDQKLAEWVQEAKSAIQNALAKITSWWVNLKVNIATGGKGVSTISDYDPETGVRTMKPDMETRASTGAASVTINQTNNMQVRDDEDVKRVFKSEAEAMIYRITGQLN